MNPGFENTAEYGNSFQLLTCRGFWHINPNRIENDLISPYFIDLF